MARDEERAATVPAHDTALLTKTHHQDEQA